jgi:hypothetical protein
VLDKTGDPIPGVRPFAARLDAARVFFLDTGLNQDGEESKEQPNSLHLRHTRKGRWYEPSRGLALGSGREAILYSRPQRLTAVALLPYSVKRIELMVERERPNGYMLRVEVLSATPVTCRHPLLVELLGGDGVPLPCGIRVVTARNGFLRWWFIPGPDSKDRARLLRVTDLLSGMLAEREVGTGNEVSGHELPHNVPDNAEPRSAGGN